MSTYTVIQDIEAEDKLIGPLTMKQFIFASIATVFAFVAFLVATKTIVYAAIPFLPFILVFGILAAPLSQSQPTDIWLAARIRFFLKSRKRLWDQNGIKELIKITAPKPKITNYVNSYSQQEIKSRLKLLADTIDSRGWSIENFSNNITPIATLAINSDRLINPTQLPKNVPDLDLNSTDDIMDNDNVLAQHFNTIVRQTTQQQRLSAINQMKNAINGGEAIEPPMADIQPSDSDNQLDRPQAQADQNPVLFKADIISPNNDKSDYATTEVNPKDLSPAERTLLDRLHTTAKGTDSIMRNHKVIETPEQILANQAQANKVMTPVKDTVIVERVKRLAKNNDDLTIASVANLANRINQNNNNDEITIKLR